MAGFDNDIVYAKNGDFTGASTVSESNGLISDKQIWVGSTATNVGGTHINVLTLTPGAGVTLTQAATTLTVGLTSGGTDLHTARFIVSAGGSANGANYTTIASAIAAAAAVTGKQTVFIQPGTYTENLTMQPSISLAAYDGDGVSENVVIKGKLTYNTGGNTVSLTGIWLETNGDFFLSVTGTSLIQLFNCFLNIDGNIGFSCSSSGGNVQFNQCEFQINTAHALFSITNSSNTILSDGITFLGCKIYNENLTTVSSTISAGQISFFSSTVLIPVTLSGTSKMYSAYNDFDCSAINQTCVTYGGNGTNTSIKDTFRSGTASSISVSQTVTCSDCSFDSTNSNAIDGAGTVIFDIASFPNTGKGIAPTITARTVEIGNLVLVNPLPLSSGGTNASLTASNGGIFYSTSTAGAILSGTATANQVLLSGASTTPTWSTATYPSTAGTSGNILTSNGTNWSSAPPATSGTVTSVSGTANQVAVATGTTTPVISLIGPYTPATYTAHGVLVGEGTSSIVALSVGATGTVLTGSTGADPVFSATPSVTSITLSSGTALNNYTEGTFTPTMVGSSTAGTPTYSIQIGRYTRIGRIVSLYHNVDWTASGGATGFIKAGGLPFTAANVSNVNYALTTYLSSNGDALASGTTVTPAIQIANNATTGILATYTSLTGAVNTVNVTSAGSWVLTGQYEV